MRHTTPQDATSAWHTAAWNLLKLGGAGATICAIAWAFLTLSPDPVEPVKQAEADIFSLDFAAPKSKEARFVEALQDEGMEKPRTYDWNGNTFFFSMKQTKDDPLTVMRDFQHTFARRGVNKKAHLKLPPSIANALPPQDLKEAAPAGQKRSSEIYTQNLERLDDFFSGGVVPTEVGRDYIAMAGTTSKQGADSGLSFLEERLKNVHNPIESNVAAMRFIDARRNPHTGLTTVTATWSDKNLDFRKFRNERDVLALSADEEIPTCIGCERLMRFAGHGDESDYTNHSFRGGGSPQQVASFYDRALSARGWEAAESSKAMELMRRRGLGPKNGAIFRTYVRGDTFLNVVIYTNERTGETTAQLVESP